MPTHVYVYVQCVSEKEKWCSDYSKFVQEFRKMEKLMGNEETDGTVLYSSKFGYVIKYDRRIMRNITPH